MVIIGDTKAVLLASQETSPETKINTIRVDPGEDLPLVLTYYTPRSDI